MSRIGNVGNAVIPALSGPGGLGGEQNSPAGDLSLCDLSDVDCTYLMEGDVLVWNGYAWVSEAVSTNPIDDAAVWMPLTTVSGGDPVLVWDGDDGLIPTLIPF